MAALVQTFLKSKPNFLRAAVLTLLVAIPLFPKFPIFSIPGTYVAIRTEDFILAIFALVFLFYLLKRRRGFFSDKLHLAIVLYLAIGLLSLISAILITKSVVPHLGFLHWLRRIEYFLPFFIAAFAISSLFEVYIFLFVLFGVGVLVFLYGIGQLYFSFPVISTSNEEFSKGLLLPLTEGARVNSTFAGQYDLGAFLAIILTLLVVFFFGTAFAAKNFFKIKLPLLALSGAFYWLLLQNGSRISFLAFLFGVASVLFLLGRKVLILPVIFVFLLGLVFSSELSERFVITIRYGINFLENQITKPKTSLQNKFVAVASEDKVSLNRLEDARNQKATTSASPKPLATPVVTAKTEKPAPGEPAELSERIIYRSGRIRFDVEWPRALRAFLKNPILGTGYSSIGLATDNDYLRALGETGILGFLAFSAVFAEVGRRIIAFFKAKIEGPAKIIVVGITGVIITLLLIAFFFDIFEASKIAILFWLLVGFCIATIRIAKEQRNA